MLLSAKSGRHHHIPDLKSETKRPSDTVVTSGDQQKKTPFINAPKSAQMLPLQWSALLPMACPMPRAWQRRDRQSDQMSWNDIASKRVLTLVPGGVTRNWQPAALSIQIKTND